MTPQLQNGISPLGSRGSNPHIVTRDHANVPSNSGNFRKHPQHLEGDNLRVAYNAQTTNHKRNNSHEHDFDHIHDNNDQNSISGGSAANSAATPSSVYMPSSVALSRDNMSDLSGVSGGTNRGSSSHTIPGQILDPKSLMRPWKQAYSLSNVPPECNKTAGSRDRTGQSAVCNDSQKSPSIWVAQNDVVEIFDNLESSLGLDLFRKMGRQHQRIPVMILLMNPSKQNYELMQIWVDSSIDSIRDLVQVLQHKLPVQWKQAYDGLFQVRGNRFTQLINIIRLVKYDIQPYEILVAKPWSMAAKVTIAIAGSAIRHLTRIGVISTDNDDSSSSSGKERHHHRRQPPRHEDAPLLLSKRAQDRAYFPEGILDHHHATQFITFSPPFESPNDNDIPIPLAGTELSGAATPEHFSSFDHTNPTNSASESQYDARTSLLGSTNDTGERKPGKFTRSVRRMIGNPLSRRQRPSLSRKHNTSSSNTKKAEHQYSEATSSLGDNSCGPVGCFSKFNCIRNSSNATATDMRKSDALGIGIGNSKPSPQTSMTSLSEEDEKRWLAYSMKPIDEDQSLANGSVVSMSAPLLSPNCDF